MAETIPGGAYKSPTGEWHDADGKKIDAPKGGARSAKAEPLSAEAIEKRSGVDNSVERVEVPHPGHSGPIDAGEWADEADAKAAKGRQAMVESMRREPHALPEGADRVTQAEDPTRFARTEYAAAQQESAKKSAAKSSAKAEK